MSFKETTIGEACDVIAGQSPPSSTYNFEGRGLPFFQGKADFGALYPTTRVWCDEPRKIAQPNDILISVRAPVGPTNLCHTEACIGRGLSAIRAKNGTDFRYVLYYLRGIEPRLSTQGRGSTFSAINQSEIRNLKIPLPPLPIQKQIAAILEKTDAVREKRRQANQLTEQFLQSAFLEMFGDPVMNPKGFDRVTVADITSEVRDGPHVSPEYVEHGIPILSTRNIRPGRLLLDDVKYVSDKDYEWLTRNFRPRVGDVLLTKGGTTGYAKVVDFDWTFCVWVHIAVLRPTTSVHPKYLEVALNSDYCYGQSQHYTHGIANKDLGVQRIPKIKLLLPPFDQQQRFAALVEKVEGLRAKQKESEKELENLFQSLMQRAFRGELVKGDVTVASGKSLLHPTDRHAAILGKIILAHQAKPQHLSTLGHVKGEKISHVLEYHISSDLGRNPVRDAAGPVDFKHLHQVEYRAAKKVWFSTRDRKGEFGKEYESQRNLDRLLKSLASELGDVEKEVDRIIELFVPMRTEQAEIVATTYAAWNDLLLEGKQPTDKQIVHEARENWTQEKLEISEKQFMSCIEWMRKKNLVPKGTGKHTIKKRNG